METRFANMATLATLLLMGTACSITTPQTTSEETSAENTSAEPGTEYGNQLGAIEYVIQEGDNLVLVASEQTRASDNWRRIADFNRIDNPASIKVGQTIWIPKDLIPLSTSDENSREVAGHPDAVVNSVRLPPRITPQTSR